MLRIVPLEDNAERCHIGKVLTYVLDELSLLHGSTQLTIHKKRWSYLIDIYLISKEVFIHRRSDVHHMGISNLHRTTENVGKQIYHSGS